MKQVLLIVLVVVLTVGAMAAGAGIYKWTTSTPHPAPISTPTPEPNLDGLIRGLLQEYVSDPDVSDIDVKCISYLRSSGARHLMGFQGIDLSYMDGKWTIRNTGDDCTGIETWEIDDAIGAITYLGPSTSP